VGEDETLVLYSLASACASTRSQIPQFLDLLDGSNPQSVVHKARSESRKLWIGQIRAAEEQARNNFTSLNRRLFGIDFLVEVIFMLEKFGTKTSKRTAVWLEAQLHERLLIKERILLGYILKFR